MTKTIIRRFLIMIPQLIVLSLFIFFVAQKMPGDPFTGKITPSTGNSKVEEQLKIKSGFYDPWYVKYKRWVGNALHGDFGDSYTQKLPVKDVIGQRAKNTFFLSLFSLIIMYAIAIPLGINAGRYSGSAFDQGVNLYNFIALATPGFVFYLIMLLIFGYKLGWFPTSGIISLEASAKGGMAAVLSRFYHMLLPAISYALLTTIGTIQYLRNEVVDAKSQDYVRTARAKGVPIKKVYSKHIFRNSLLPIAAFFGFQITGLLAGSIMIETIFGYQGMGSLFVDCINQRDYSVMTALVMIYGFLTLCGSLLSDIIMSIVDPRIRID